jgi:hypothetical protein
MLLKRRAALFVAAMTSTLCLATVVPTAVSATSWPSGQRMLAATTFNFTTGHFTGGGATIEPAINDANGNLVYLLTPNKVLAHPNDHNVANIYLPVYPVGSGIDPTTLNCAHLPGDNCADHGPGVAGAAANIMPNVYGGGVVGHDHLVGIASTKGDFNIIWQPVLVLFTNPDAATTRLLTLDGINAALANGDVIEIPLPQLDFNCSVVSASVYDHATPGPVIGGP